MVCCDEPFLTDCTDVLIVHYIISLDIELRKIDTQSRELILAWNIYLPYSHWELFLKEKIYPLWEHIICFLCGQIPFLNTWEANTIFKYLGSKFLFVKSVSTRKLDSTYTKPSAYMTCDNDVTINYM